MEQGVYYIATYQALSQILDVTSASTSNEASIILYENHQGNNQRFLLQNIDSTYMSLRAVNSNKVVDVFGNRAADRTDVIQYTWHNGNNQLWEPVDSSTCTINGQNYVSKVLRSKMRDSLVLDASGAKSNNNTNVIVYTYHGGNNQKWVFVKDTRHDSSFAVPANIGLATSTTGGRNTTISCNSTPVTFYPYWQCQGSYWQLRWRWRGRKTGTSTWSGWTNWYSISNTSVPNGSTNDLGWGNAWTYNVSATGNGSERRSSRGISVNIDQGTYDKKEIQIEVRQFAPNNIKLDGVSISTHGSSATQTVNAVYRPTLSCQEISFSPTGLQVPITSDFKRNGNTALINSITVNGKTLVSNFKASNLSYTGNGAIVEIPISNLSFIPNDNDTAKMSVKYTTIDGTWTYNLNPKIKYNTSHGLTLSPVFTNADGWTERAKLNGTYTDSHCWLMVENEGRTSFSECEKDSSGRFIIVPPLNKPYTLFFSAETSSAWGTLSVVRPAIQGCKYFLFNWDEEYAVLPWDANVSWGLSRDANVIQTQGRYFESVFFGKGSSRQININGRLLDNDGVDRSSFFDFEKLSVSDYAIVRFPTGERFDAAIEKVNFSYSNRRYRDVSVTCREVS